MEKNPTSTNQSGIQEPNENTLAANIPPLKWLVAMRRKLKIGPKLVIGFGILIAMMLVGYGWGIYSSSLATLEINRTTNFRSPTALA